MLSQSETVRANAESVPKGLTEMGNALKLQIGCDFLDRFAGAAEKGFGFFHPSGHAPLFGRHRMVFLEIALQGPFREAAAPFHGGDLVTLLGRQGVPILNFNQSTIHRP